MVKMCYGIKIFDQMVKNSHDLMIKCRIIQQNSKFRYFKLSNACFCKKNEEQ